MENKVKVYEWPEQLLVDHYKDNDGRWYNFRGIYYDLQFKKWRESHKRYKVAVRNKWRKIPITSVIDYSEIMESYGFVYTKTNYDEIKIYTYKDIFSIGIGVLVGESLERKIEENSKSTYIDADHKLIQSVQTGDALFCFLNKTSDYFTPNCPVDLIPEFLSEFLPFAKAVVDDYNDNVSLREAKIIKVGKMSFATTSTLLSHVFDKLNLKVSIRNDSYSQTHRVQGVIPTSKKKNLDMYVNNQSTKVMSEFPEMMEKLITIVMGLENICISFSRIKRGKKYRFRHSISVDCDGDTSPMDIIEESKPMINEFMETIMDMDIELFKTTFK